MALCLRCKAKPFTHVTPRARALCLDCLGDPPNPAACDINAIYQEGHAIANYLSKLVLAFKETQVYRIQRHLIHDLQQMQAFVESLLAVVRGKDAQTIAIVAEMLQGERLWQPQNKATLQANRLYKVTVAKEKRINELQKEVRQLKSQNEILRRPAMMSATQMGRQTVVKDKRNLVQQAMQPAEVHLSPQRLRGQSARTQLQSQPSPTTNTTSPRVQPQITAQKKSQLQPPQISIKVKRSVQLEQLQQCFSEIKQKYPNTMRLNVYLKEHKLPQGIARVIEQGIASLPRLRYLLINNFYKSCGGFQFEAMKELRLLGQKCEECHLLGRQWL